MHSILYALALLLSAVAAAALVLGGFAMVNISQKGTYPSGNKTVQVMGVVQVVVGALFGLSFFGLLTARRWAPLASAIELFSLGLVGLVCSSAAPSRQGDSQVGDMPVVVGSVAMLVVGGGFLVTTLRKARDSRSQVATASR